MEVRFSKNIIIIILLLTLVAIIFVYKRDMKAFAECDEQLRQSVVEKTRSIVDFTSEVKEYQSVINEQDSLIIMLNNQIDDIKKEMVVYKEEYDKHQPVGITVAPD